MGEPRLSDIAPDLSADRASKEARRSNSLKANLRADRRHNLYSPLPTSERAAIDLSENEDDDEEVFFGDGSAKYYNFSAAGGNNGRRRHSIGTTMIARERTLSVPSSGNAEFGEDFPQTVVIHSEANGSVVLGSVTSPITVVDDHSMRHSSYPRKRCNRCTRGKLVITFITFSSIA